MLDMPRNVKGASEMSIKAEGTRDKTESYGSFLKNVHTFRAMDILPVVLNFGEDMTVDDLVQNREAWHKSCYVKFSKKY